MGRTGIPITPGVDLYIYVAHAPRSHKWVYTYTNYLTDTGGKVGGSYSISGNVVTMTFPTKLLGTSPTFKAQVFTEQLGTSSSGATTIDVWDLAPNEGSYVTMNL